MPLGGREMARAMQISIQGRDEASAAIDNVAGSLGGLGKAGGLAGYQMFALGLILQKAGRGFITVGTQLKNIAMGSLQLAENFDYSMRLVQTQAHLSSKGFKAMETTVLQMAQKVTPTLDEMGQGLYDIFSSTFISEKGAIKMLGIFSKAATATGTDLRTVTRSGIGMMNAFGLKAKDMTHIMDAQFRMVELGVGTYQDFVTGLGDVAPSAVAAGQSLNQMSALLAFTTRNGLSASKAAISVARAMDLITRPKNIAGLKALMGINVVDPKTHKFKSFSNIITEMGTQMQGMTAPERKQKLFDIFGVGEIRAMRFFNIAIPRFKELNTMVSKFSGKQVGGALQRAFDVMKASPTVQLKILVNQLKALGTIVGAFLLPVLAVFIQYGHKLLNWFNGLSDHTKKLIIYFIAIAGAILLILGHVLVLIGGLAMFASLLTFLTGATVTLGAAFVTIISVIGIVILVIVALVAAGYLIYKNWAFLKKWAVIIWHAIYHAVVTIIHALQQFLHSSVGVVLIGIIKTAWETIKALTLAAWSIILLLIVHPLQSLWRTWIYPVMHTLTVHWRGVWGVMKAIVMGVWKDIVELVKVAVNDVIIVINAILRAVNIAIRALNRIPGHPHINEIGLIPHLYGLDAPGKPGANLAPGSAGAGRPTRARGGPASGWTWTGEEGPELVKLPTGSQVYSHQQSIGMGGINVTVNGPIGPELARQIARELSWELKTRGASHG